MFNTVFETSTRTILLLEPPNPSTGTVDVDVQKDLYSNGKYQWTSDLDLNKFIFPLRAVGGDPLPGSKQLGDTYFLNPDWKIRPYEADHVLNVEGNLYSEDGTSPFTETLGTYRVTIISTVSSLVDSTIQQLPEIEYASFQNGVTINQANGTTGIEYPRGTRQMPVNNLTDAVAIAELRGFNRLYFIGDYNFPASAFLNNYELIGEGSQTSTFSFTAGSLLPNCRVYSATVTGTCDGISRYQDCQLSDFGSIGVVPNNETVIIRQSVLGGTISIPSNYSGILMALDCWGFGDDNPLILDLGNASCNCIARGYSGPVELSNYSYSGGTVSIDLNSGGITLNSSITDGNIIIRGVGTLIDDSSGATITTDALINKQLVAEAVEQEIGTEIQFAAFNDAVWLDACVGIAGTTYPAGSQLAPVNNIQDAVAIAVGRGYNEIHFLSDYTLSGSCNVSGYTLMADGTKHLKTGSGLTNNTVFDNIMVSGALNGYTLFRKATIDSSGITNFYGVMEYPVINGPIQVSSDNTKNAIFIEPFVGDVTGPSVIDCNGDGAKVSIRGLTGPVFLKNKTGDTQKVFIDMYSGRIGFDSTITAGDFDIRGIGYIYQNDASGTSTFETTGLMSKTTVAEAVQIQIGAEIEYAAFGNVVTLDAVNGMSGTGYPIGTPLLPVNNLADAKSIAASRGFNTIEILSDLSINSGEDISDLTFTSKNWFIIDIDSSVISDDAIFTKIDLRGELSGTWNVLYDCWMTDVSNFTGWMIGGSIEKLALAPWNETGVGESFFDDLVPIYPNFESVIIMNTSTNVVFTESNGDYLIKESSTNSKVDFGLAGGTLTIDNTCTGGDFIVRGIGNVVNNSSLNIDEEGLMSKATVTEAVWDEPLFEHTLPGTTGRSLSFLQFGGKVWYDPINGQSGTQFPIGTEAYPANNGPDVRTIRLREGLYEVRIQGEITAALSTNNLIFSGNNFIQDKIHFQNSITYDTVIFRNLYLDGSVNAENCLYENCYVTNISGLSGEMIGGRLKDYIGVAPGKTLSGTKVVAEGDFTTIDLMSDPSTVVSLDVDSGYIKFINAVAGSLIELNLKGGEIELDPTCIGGEFYIEGTGTLYNDSSMTVKGDNLQSLESIPAVVWNSDITTTTDPSTAAYSIWNMPKKVVNKVLPFLFAK